MAYTLIDTSPIQIQKNAAGNSASGYYLKLYAAGTTTPISMYTTSVGGGALAKCQIDAEGFAINGSGDVFIPYVDQTYKLVVYTNSTDADANTFASAFYIVDSIPQVSGSPGYGDKPYDMTLAEFKASTILVAGDVVTISDRAGATFDIASGVSGANSYNVIANNAGTLKATLRIEEELHVGAYGVVDDGSDQTTVLQSALDYCETNSVFVKGIAGTVVTSGTINISCSGDLSMMTISCPGATVTTAVQVGKTSGTNAIYNQNIKVPVVTNSSKVGAGWSGFESSVGVDIGNCYYSSIFIPRIVGFGTNLYIGGKTIGCSYNHIHLLQCLDGKINMKLGGKSGSAWANENNIYCGVFARSSSEGTSPITGAYSIFFDGVTGTNCNNNVLYKPSVEVDSDEYQINFEDASFNTIINPRFEVTGGGRVRFYSSSSGETNSNVIIGGYAITTPTFTYAGSTAPNNKWYGTRHGDSYGFSGNGIAISNSSSSGITAPHIQGFEAGQNALGKTSSSTDWKYRLYGSGFAVKSGTDTEARAYLDAGTGRYYMGAGGVSAPTSYLGPVGASAIGVNTTFHPVADNTTTLGSASFRWSVVYAGTGTINTSDEREKQDIRPISEKELAVAVKLKGLVRAFRWKSNPDKFHFGVIAQQVEGAFVSEGLNASDYGLIAIDDVENGEVRYGVNYNELLAFILCAL